MSSPSSTVSARPQLAQSSPSTTVVAIVVVAILIGCFIVIGGISYGVQRYQARNKALQAMKILDDIEVCKLKVVLALR
jgi:uncharacterized membrane protein HdeD (DUF308 family)